MRMWFAVPILVVGLLVGGCGSPEESPQAGRPSIPTPSGKAFGGSEEEFILPDPCGLLDIMGMQRRSGLSTPTARNRAIQNRQCQVEYGLNPPEDVEKHPRTFLDGRVYGYEIDVCTLPELPGPDRDYVKNLTVPGGRVSMDAKRYPDQQDHIYYYAYGCAAGCAVELTISLAKEEDWRWSPADSERFITETVPRMIAQCRQL